MTMQVQGLDNLGKNLAEIGEKGRAVLIKSARKSLLVRVIGKAKTKVPVDTGTLKRSLTVGDENNIDETLQSGNDIQIKMGSRVHYAPDVEYGHKVRVSSSGQAAMAKYGGGASGGKVVAAKPYLRPAWDEGKDQIPDDIARDLKKELEKGKK